MPLELVITVGALLISWFVFTGLVRLLKVTVGTALKIALILFALQVFFGIGPEALGERILQLWEQLLGKGK
ncbi:hypothetical protein [Synechococcus sp. PCC 6312]|uniref:hypothetical protein n=1 Tax=Synechococcus sp. (strain ATCC 27167 / PCC 6312) TaxID=195253 RepID=UPI00029F00A2|nr:hypothetical protein [Synechococcus sp. PCC 6312]AFY59975.1 hypothetical protein Syn6312_0758 [Synechococcus sp. PCC 6312]